jgi:hypothetical protein
VDAATPVKTPGAAGININATAEARNPIAKCGSCGSGGKKEGKEGKWTVQSGDCPYPQNPRQNCGVELTYTVMHPSGHLLLTNCVDRLPSRSD